MFGRVPIDLGDRPDLPEVCLSRCPSWTRHPALYCRMSSEDCRSWIATPYPPCCSSCAASVRHVRLGVPGHTICRRHRFASGTAVHAPYQRSSELDIGIPWDSAGSFETPDYFRDLIPFPCCPGLESAAKAAISFVLLVVLGVAT